ncbi:hypothetical protein N434_01644 [Rhizobium sp. UGM030330-04]|nr:hypothetical protein N434_01644 [Rhizobium sp. UGM030330-04]
MASPRNGRDAILTMGSDSPSALPARVQCNKRLRQSVAQDSDGFVTGGEVSGGCAIHGGAEGGKPHAPPLTFPEHVPKTQQLHPARRCRTGDGQGVSGDCPAALWLGLVWVGCVAQPGLSRMPYSARAVHRLLRNGPATTNVVSVPIIRTVPRSSPRLASTRRDCGHYSRAGRGGEKRGRCCRERQPSLRVTWWCSAARSCLSAASSASTFTSIFSCSDSTSSSAFRFTS